MVWGAVKTPLYVECFKKKDLIYLLVERGEREGETYQCVRDTSIGCFSHAPNWEPGLQPRHVP